MSDTNLSIDVDGALRRRLEEGAGGLILGLMDAHAETWMGDARERALDTARLIIEQARKLEAEARVQPDVWVGEADYPKWWRARIAVRALAGHIHDLCPGGAIPNDPAATCSHCNMSRQTLDALIDLCRAVASGVHTVAPTPDPEDR